MDELWLAAALRAAKASGSSGRELRRLQWQALECSRGTSPDVPDGQCVLAWRLEEVLQVAEEVAGRPFRRAGDVAQVLKGDKFASLRRRLQRLSRGRNVEAHPDPSLVQDLQRALGAVRGRDGDSTEASTEENFDASSGAESHASIVWCKGDAWSRLEVLEHRVLHLEQRLEQQEPDGLALWLAGDGAATKETVEVDGQGSAGGGRSREG